jgi:predicted phosphodiesterase
MTPGAGTAAPLPALPESSAPLPAPFVLDAPTDWRAIDFISDLHLSPALPRTFESWARYLRETPADAVFMLGDLFEVWVGDDARDLPFERRCVEVLADAAHRRRIGFMAGNRDFLVGAEMLRASGLVGLPDPTLLSAWGRRALLTHGDALCLADTDYRPFAASCVAKTGSASSVPARLPGASNWRPRCGARASPGGASTVATMPTSTPRRHWAGCAPPMPPCSCTATRTGPAASSSHPASSAMC